MNIQFEVISPVIGYFPSAYPDELLYSVCARFNERMGLLPDSQVMLTLFGTQNIKAVIDVPSHLGNLVARLPHGHHCSVDRLIQNHTLFPIYAPFLTAKRVQTIWEGMCGHRKQGVNFLLGISQSQITTHEQLIFCPSCVAEDRQQYGECYWHRVHQVPGIQVCPIHSVWLMQSDVAVHHQYSFIAAEHAVRNLKSRLIHHSETEYDVHLSLARDAVWLLNNPRQTSELSALRKRYQILLYQRGLATYTGHIHTNKLMSAFKRHFSPKFLESLGCEFDSKIKRNWLARLVQANQTQHPVRHLLLIQFLDHTTESLWKTSTDFPPPFGNGPWPCLNKVCPYYSHPIISTIQLGISNNVQHLPLGTFICPHCSYAYKRIGSDQTKDDHLKGTVIQYGDLWDQNLREIWIRKDLTQREKATLLGVSVDVVNYQANRLGIAPSNKSQSINRSVKRIYSHEEIIVHRAKWLSAVEQNPSAGVAELENIVPKSYRILAKYDLAWWQANKPVPNRSIPLKKCRVDWSARDYIWADEARKAAIRLKNKVDRVCRITANSIAREMGIKERLLQKNLAKLPSTTTVINKYTETHEDFAVRRIKCLAEDYLKRGVKPTRWDFIKRAGLSKAIQSKKVIEYLDEILYHLINIY